MTNIPSLSEEAKDRLGDLLAEKYRIGLRKIVLIEHSKKCLKQAINLREQALKLLEIANNPKTKEASRVKYMDNMTVHVEESTAYQDIASMCQKQSDELDKRVSEIEKEILDMGIDLESLKGK